MENSIFPWNLEKSQKSVYASGPNLGSKISNDALPNASGPIPGSLVTEGDSVESHANLGPFTPEREKTDSGKVAEIRT